MRADQPRTDLRADCERCVGLCCVVPALTRSTDFAIDKPAGQPCPNLTHDFRCGIHDRLRQKGFPGCAAYDCFGAGQKVTQLTFGGQDWRQTPSIAEHMFWAFTIMRQLHELLWYLTEALALACDGALQAELGLALEETDSLTRHPSAALVTVDVATQREAVNVLLRRTSDLVRAGASPGVDHRGADLVGAGLRGADLAGANLRGASLVSADLRDAVLRLADLTGTDLRGTDLRGADLGTSIFLTQAQVDSAHGDNHTRLPPRLARPAHWLDSVA